MSEPISDEELDDLRIWVRETEDIEYPLVPMLHASEIRGIVARIDSLSDALMDAIELIEYIECWGVDAYTTAVRDRLVGAL